MSESLDLEIRTLQSVFWSERDPDGLAFAPLADALRRNGQLRDALDLLTEGTTRQPEYATGHLVAARLYAEQGMHAEAELAARRVLDLDPENTQALSTLVVTLHERGEHGEAATVRSALVAADPDSAEARAVSGLELVEAPEVGGDESILPDVALDSGAIGSAPVDAEAGRPEASASDELELDTLDDEYFTDEALGLDSPSLDDSVEAEAALPEGPAEGALDLAAPAPDALESPPEDAPPEDTLVDLAALAPDAPAEPEASVDDAMDLATLAPDPPTEDVLDLATLAPDPAEPPPEDTLVDLAALAPDALAEPGASADGAMDLASLAPDPDLPAVEDTIERTALVPDAPSSAPDNVMDLAALAPDVPAEDVMELAALAPEPPTEPESTAEDVVELAALAPEPPTESESTTEDTVELAALAPDSPDASSTEEGVLDLAALAPDPVEPASVDTNEPASGPRGNDVEDGEPVYTRTLAELYVRQGFMERAAEVYRHLLGAEPDAQDLRQRLAELEGDEPTPTSTPRSGATEEAPGEPREADPAEASGAGSPDGGAVPPVDGSGETEEEVETLARDLADAGDDSDDVDTPFAWSAPAEDAETGPAERSDGDGAAGYFDGLLDWGSREDR